MIGNDGKPVTREMLRTAIGVYGSAARGSQEFMSLPRALITILDNLSVGKTTYVKASDGQLQVTRRKDKSIAVS